MNFFFLKTLKILPALILAGLVLSGCSDKDRRTASRESAGIAPDPASTKEAVLQVYGARAWGWRGRFAIHTWIAAKRTGADSYMVYDVVGWRSHHNQPVMRARYDVPDRLWYGEIPRILKEHRGNDVDKLIDAVEMVDQSPIGKSPRSNPITYVKAFDVIRQMFADTYQARIRGYKPGYFSFNVPGGRCETCQGEGVVRIEMQFLADLFLECEACKGRRFS